MAPNTEPTVVAMSAPVREKVPWLAENPANGRMISLGMGGENLSSDTASAARKSPSLSMRSNDPAGQSRVGHVGCVRGELDKKGHRESLPSARMQTRLRCCAHARSSECRLSGSPRDRHPRLDAVRRVRRRGPPRPPSGCPRPRDYEYPPPRRESVGLSAAFVRLQFAPSRLRPAAWRPPPGAPGHPTQFHCPFRPYRKRIEIEVLCDWLFGARHCGHILGTLC